MSAAESTPPRATLSLSSATWFWFLVCAQLIPIWSFQYLPTQDGPSHLANAIILRDFNKPDTHFRDYFQVAAEPIPNWTFYVLSYCLLQVFPPLVTEKIIVSLIIVAGACSFRFFLRSIGRDLEHLAPVGLLFIFNRCLLMGFYNYCLSLGIVWLAIGYSARYRKDFALNHAAVLMGILLAGYFTHLLGFLLAALAVIPVVIGARSARWRRLMLVLVAMAPAGFLTAGFLMHTGFFTASQPGDVFSNLWQGISDRAKTAGFSSIVEEYDDQLYGAYAPSVVPLGSIVLILCEILIVASVLVPPGKQPSNGYPGMARPPRLALVILGLMLAAAYLLVPDSLGTHGAFLKARLALLVPMVWLGCLRVPSSKLFLNGLRIAVTCLIAVNLGCLTWHFQRTSRDIAELTAAVAEVGENHTVSMTQGGMPAKLVNYFEHGVDYYCLGTGNIDVRNYEALTTHFPIRWRSGPPENSDVIIGWDLPAENRPSGGYQQILERGRLTVFKMVVEPRSGTVRRPFHN